MKRMMIVLGVLSAASGCYRQVGEDDGEPGDDTDSSTQGVSETSYEEGQAYDQGVYRCCAKGEGTGCCEGYETGMCFEYGGLYRDCIPQGEEYEGKVICAHCCAGLERAEAMIVTDEDWTEAGYPAGCGPSDAPPSMGICVDCGDGRCGAGENICICPEDCS